jgi:hypothetical protein
MDDAKSKTSLDAALAYTIDRESRGDPSKVNTLHKSRPTTGFLHIEQPTYADNIRKMYNKEGADMIRSLKPSEYIQYIQDHPKEEMAVGSRIIQKNLNMWGDMQVVDARGDKVPAWRAAYTMGNTGLINHLVQSGQLQPEIENKTAEHQNQDEE